MTPFHRVLLAIADDRLLLGSRSSDWTGLAPILEEDIAFSALAQDDLAHAQVLYEHVAEATGGNADALALGRPAPERFCCRLVELPDDFDWAVAIVRRFLMSHLEVLRLDRLARSSDAALAKKAARMRREAQVSLEHAAGWVRHLAAGTDEARSRLRAALERLAPEAAAVCEPVEGEAEAVAAGQYPELADGRPTWDAWRANVVADLGRAGLPPTLPDRPPSGPGGRRGAHSEHLAPLLAEISAVWALEPDAAW